jgi:hypothetical protein
LDRRPVGLTPVTVEGRYGGVREIILLKKAHLPAVVYHDTERFMLDTPPFDAFADLTGAEDHQVVKVTLQTNQVQDWYEADKEGLLRALRERAETLRSRALEHSLQAPPREPILPEPPSGQ